MFLFCPSSIKLSVVILKYKQFKNAFKTVLGRSEAEIINILCFDHFLSVLAQSN